MQAGSPSAHSVRFSAPCFKARLCHLPLQVTLRGDMAALAASLCFVGYLLIGQRLRVWMPAFVYAFL